MRWVVALVLVSSACTIDGLDLTGKTCPCADGWECDPARNVCVEISGEDDAGPRPDAGDAADADLDDAGDEADARPRDGGMSDAPPVDAPVVDAFEPCTDPTTEVCNGRDDDCDEDVDEGYPVGNDCTVGVGECERDGTLVCDGPDSVECDVSPGAPETETCNTQDDDCDGSVDEDGCESDTIYETCADALASGETSSGPYRLRPNGGSPVAVYCDMSTDEGGWTLVASSESQTPNDQASGYYGDLSRLNPFRGHNGVWDALRGRSALFDVRFACRDEELGASAPFTVDLSFYDVTWYVEWTVDDDVDSCFSEDDGDGADAMAPERRNNLTGVSLPLGDPFNADGYLEGEDDCDDEGDFTVDFDDRGMDSNEGDGTDWGEDDGDMKCGFEDDLAEGQWFIFVRET